MDAEIAAQLERRRAAAAASWNLGDEVVLIGAGEPIGVPGRGDLTYPFRAHSEYFYLTDRNRPGGVLAYDPREGWIDFVAPVTAAERLWSGATPLGADTVTTDRMEEWLAARAWRPVVWLGSSPPHDGDDPDRIEELRCGLDAVRRPKDAVELERMRHAERATRAAFGAAVPFLRSGVSERELQVKLEAAAFRAGGDAMAYDTIVGGGPNSAVLHFPPSARCFTTGELVLIDAGAEVQGYASDITRTYPVGGTFSPEQRDLHDLVSATLDGAVARCRPGTEWRDVHRYAALTIAEGLVELGVLRGQPESLVESGAAFLFFPHGIGHLVGLGVRDAGGPLAERRGDPPPFPNLRIDLPLGTGMTVTVEPGIYFVPALLEDPEPRRQHHDEVVWDRVDRMLGFGGIRIEHNVLVTDGDPDVITADVPLLG